MDESDKDAWEKAMDDIEHRWGISAREKAIRAQARRQRAQIAPDEAAEASRRQAQIADLFKHTHEDVDSKIIKQMIDDILEGDGTGYPDSPEETLKKNREEEAKKNAKVLERFLKNV